MVEESLKNNNFGSGAIDSLLANALATGAHAASPARARYATALTAVAAFAVAVAIDAFAGSAAPAFSAAIYLLAIFAVTFLAGWRWGLPAWIASVALLWWFAGRPAFDLFQSSPHIALFALAGGLQFGAAALVRKVLINSRRAEMRLLQLIDATSGTVFMTDGAGRALKPNPAWSQTTGMQWADYKDRGWLAAVHPEDRAKLPIGNVPEGSKAHLVDVRIADSGTGDWRWHRLRSIPALDDKGHIVEWVGTIRDVHERKLAEDKRDLVVGELRHRLKNLVTVIDALAKNSRLRGRNSPDVDEFMKRFLGRLHALGGAADLVLAGNRVAIDAHAVVRATLVPFLDENSPRIRIEGPPLDLSEEIGGGLALAVHELATNALKYGALSGPTGTVTIAWSVTPVADGDEIVFEWIERGGPEPEPPAREGFGSRVIKAVTAREKIGGVTLDYRPEGVHCRIAYIRPRPAVNPPSP